MGQAKKDWQDWTTRIELPVQDCNYKTGMAELKREATKRKPEQVSKNRTTRMEQPEWG